MKKLYIGIAIGALLLLSQQTFPWWSFSTPETKKSKPIKQAPPISTKEMLATVPLIYGISHVSTLAHELGHSTVGQVPFRPFGISLNWGKTGLSTGGVCWSMPHPLSNSILKIPMQAAGPLAGVAFSVGALHALNTYQEYRKGDKTLKEAYAIAKEGNPFNSNYNLLATAYCYKKILFNMENLLPLSSDINVNNLKSNNTSRTIFIGNQTKYQRMLNLISRHSPTTTGKITVRGDGAEIFSILKVPKSIAWTLAGGAYLGTIGYLGKKLYTLEQNNSGFLC